MMSPLRKQTKSISYVLVAFLLALSSVSESKSTVTLSADQYHPSPSDELLKSQHRFGKPIAESTLGNDIAVPDLQVGCGDGVFVEGTTAKPVESKLMSSLLKPKERMKRSASTSDRNSRSFYYTVFTPSSLSYTAVFKPQTYRLERPYYIPVWGSQSRFPIYFPPQPIFLNPEFPLNYPPPVPKPTTTTTPPPPPPVDPSILEDRFASIDGSPVWDSRPAAPTTQSTPIPTRRPNRPKTSTFPPLIHQLNPTTASPIVADVEKQFEQKESKITDIFGTAPPPPAVPMTTAAPARNPCAWAIINCCTAGSSTFNTACFERLGCPGPFWDRSPCESDFAKRALSYATNYFNK